MENITRSIEEVSIHYTNAKTINTMSDTLITYLPATLRPIVVLCIGTDRSTGDSLGPLTGTLLSQMRLQQLIVYGTLHHPVHALNLTEQLNYIEQTYHNPFIIALDASLGKVKSIGHLITSKTSLQPGAALNKDLPAVGDVSLTGVVNVGGMMDYAVLQSTRLSIVHDMAAQLATILQKADCWLQIYEHNKQLSI